MRVDKYLWCVRLFKSRTLAAEAVARGRVAVGGTAVKASRELQLNDVFTLKRPPVVYTFRVKGFPTSRLGAKLVGDFLEDLTPQSEKDKLRPTVGGAMLWRDPGSGRPTKKERREIDAFQSYLFEEDDSGDDGEDIDSDREEM